jgi:CBS domain-containing protein
LLTRAVLTRRRLLARSVPYFEDALAMTLLASDVMTQDVISVMESAPLKQVAQMFVERKITGAPVVNRDGELVGVISETDIIRKTNNIGAWSPTTAGQIMTKPAVTVAPDDTLQRVCEMMYERRIHRVIVADETRIRGVLTSMDILRAIATRLKGRSDTFEG